MDQTKEPGRPDSDIWPDPGSTESCMTVEDAVAASDMFLINSRLRVENSVEAAAPSWRRAASAWPASGARGAPAAGGRATGRSRWAATPAGGPGRGPPRSRGSGMRGWRTGGTTRARGAASPACPAAPAPAARRPAPGPAALVTAFEAGLRFAVETCKWLLTQLRAYWAEQERQQLCREIAHSTAASAGNPSTSPREASA